MGQVDEPEGLQTPTCAPRKCGVHAVARQRPVQAAAGTHRGVRIKALGACEPGTRAPQIAAFRHPHSRFQHRPLRERVDFMSCSELSRRQKPGSRSPQIAACMRSDGSDPPAAAQCTATANYPANPQSLLILKPCAWGPRPSQGCATASRRGRCAIHKAGKLRYGQVNCISSLAASDKPASNETHQAYLSLAQKALLTAHLVQLAISRPASNETHQAYLSLAPKALLTAHLVQLRSRPEQAHGCSATQKHSSTPVEYECISELQCPSAPVDSELQQHGHEHDDQQAVLQPQRLPHILGR